MNDDPVQPASRLPAEKEVRPEEPCQARQWREQGGQRDHRAEHKEGELVTGRIADISGGWAKVELGEGVRATCVATAEGNATMAAGGSEGRADLSSLTSMLASKWKKGAAEGAPEKREPARAGQIRSFRIVRIDPEQKKIELELAG